MAPGPSVIDRSGADRIPRVLRERGERLVGLIRPKMMALEGLPSALRWAGLMAGAFGILVLRRPETLLVAEFSNEDGQVYYLAPFFMSPLESVIRPWGGYLVVAPRLAALVAHLVPVVLAPLITNLIALVVVMLVAGFLASARLSDTIPERRLRILLAAVLLLLPGSFETLGTITNIHWYLAIYLTAMSVATPARTRLIGFADATCVAISALSGPFAILLSPLYVARWLRERDRASLGLVAIVVGAAIVQAALVIAIGGRTADPVPVVEVLVYRVVYGLVLGAFWTLAAGLAGAPTLLVAIGAVLLAAAWLSVAISGLPSRARSVLLFAGAAVLVSSLVVLRGGYRDLLVHPFIEGRYFVVPGFVVAAAVVVGAGGGRGRPRIAAAGLAALLTLAIVGDFRLPAHPPLDWPLRSTCIGGAAPCDVPVDPPERWTIHWPGLGGVYDQPLR